jgi:NADH-quinone oxidoreductase subunit N
MIDDIAGLWLVQPGLATAMAVCLFAFLGMPFVGGMGFFAKWYVLQSALQASSPQTILAIILVVTSAVSAAYYLGVVTAMFMRARTEGAHHPIASPVLRSLIAVSVGTILVLGVYPTPVMNVARQALTGASLSAGPGQEAAPASAPRLQAADYIAP